MSVIVAVKENGVVYMGADSQTTTGKRQQHNLNQTAFKVHKMDNGVLVGFCGRVATSQTILSFKDLFTLDTNGDLNKRHIVKEIVPKLVDKIELIGDENCGEMDVSILIAYKDKLYKIKDSLDVVKLNEFAKSGSGGGFVSYTLIEEKHLPVRERIIKALVASARRSEAVSGPYVLIDTKNLEYEIVDKGDENY